MIEEKKMYLKVMTYPDRMKFVCELKDLAAMTAESGAFETQEVWMTEAEFEALPEFES